MVDSLASQTIGFYGDRLVSLCLFGSVARGTMGYCSDIDLLIVADPLPAGRIKRVQEFEAVEKKVEPALAAARGWGVDTQISAFFKTPQEVRSGSWLLLDMLDDGKILYDKEGFLAQYFDLMRQKLVALGARRVWAGETWYWILKPDYRPGDVIDL